MAGIDNFTTLSLAALAWDGAVGHWSDQ